MVLAANSACARTLRKGLSGGGLLSEHMDCEERIGLGVKPSALSAQRRGSTAKRPSTLRRGSAAHGDDLGFAAGLGRDYVKG
jgi:hypothetical protein